MGLKFDGKGTSAFKLTPNDSVDLANTTSRIHVNETGVINVVFQNDTTRVSLTVNIGESYPYAIKRLYQTGTTANNVVGIT